MKIRCLLVDDEPPALAVLRSHIAAVPMLEVVAGCHNAIAAFEALQKHPVDLMFLDVKMPSADRHRLSAFAAQPAQGHSTTAHREYALDGYDLDIVDYLLKPISLDRFLRAIQKVYRLESNGLVTDARPARNGSLPKRTASSTSAPTARW
jgi:DNA-binding LytR/AlgR family response regulator